MMSVGQFARAVPGSQVVGAAQVRVSGVSTDSRRLPPGALFAALTGDRFDGHDFAAAAVDQGAAALLVERQLPLAVPQIVVPDVRRALGIAAAAWRRRFQLPVIAVTGSNGKTTVTQMIAAIFAAAYGGRVDRARIANGAGSADGAGVTESVRGRTAWLATRGNLNNDIGVPLMLFELAARHRAAVFELGTNHPGEIAPLAQMVQPLVALVNNAQREHQEFFESIDATAHENGAVIANLPLDGSAIFPAYDAGAPLWRRLAGTRRVIDFARGGAATVTGVATAAADGTQLTIETPAGPLTTTLRAAGEHNVDNALAAAACALAIGVPLPAIAAGLAAFEPVAGRGTRRRIGAVELIDDSYNANPDSVRAAIDVLAQARAPRVLVLGDMGEVGRRGVEFHAEVGAYARTRGIDTLIGFGAAVAAAVAAFGAAARHPRSLDELEAQTVAALGSGGTVLIKGSRFMQMERLVERLSERLGAGAAAAESSPRRAGGAARAPLAKMV